MLVTQSFVYIPTDFFCPIPFTKPLSVAYIAVSVYGVFLVIFVTIYLWIYVYASRTTSITVQRRRTIDRQFTMLKRIILPTFSLIFLGIVYLSLFFQAVANHYQTHFLTYRLSYLFIAIGMSFIHIITILQTPSIRKVVFELFCYLKGQMWKREENLNIIANNLNATTQQQQRRDEQMATPGSRRNKIEPAIQGESYQLAEINRTRQHKFSKQIVSGFNSVK